MSLEAIPDRRAFSRQPNLLSKEVRARLHAQIMTPVHIEHSRNYFCRMLANC